MAIQVPTQEHIIPAILERIAVASPRKQGYSGALLPIYEAEVSRDTYKVAKFNPSQLQVEDFKRGYGKPAHIINTNQDHFTSIPMNRYTVQSKVDRAELHGSTNIIHSSLMIREERLKHAYTKLMQSIESQQLVQILNKSAYEAVGTTTTPNILWDQTNSDPITDILNAKSIIKNKVGFSPNVCVLSEKVWNILRSKKDLLALLPDTTLRSGLTPEDFASIIGTHKVHIADNMIYVNETLQYAWGDNVVLAYVPETLNTLDEPCYGVTVRGPLGYDSMREYFDDSTTCDITAIDEKLGWAVTNYEAGYLFHNVLSNKTTTKKS